MSPGRARRVVAVVPDLMDRSRLAAPGCDVTHVTAGQLRSAVEAGGVDLVVVDLSRPGILEQASDLSAPVVGFLPHVDEALLTRAGAEGIEAMARSLFFRRWPAVGPIDTGPRS